MGLYRSTFELQVKQMIARKMRKVAKTLLKKLIRYTPIESGHAVGDWRFCRGTPSMTDNETFDKSRSGLALSQSLAEIEAWDGIEAAYVVCNARKKSKSYPDGFMYLIMVNDSTAKYDNARFIERAIEETMNEVGNL